jgi:hypothetical protein
LAFGFLDLLAGLGLYCWALLGVWAAAVGGGRGGLLLAAALARL